MFCLITSNVLSSYRHLAVILGASHDYIVVPLEAMPFFNLELSSGEAVDGGGDAGEEGCADAIVVWESGELGSGEVLVSRYRSVEVSKCSVL